MVIGTITTNFLQVLTIKMTIGLKEAHHLHSRFMIMYKFIWDCTCSMHMERYAAGKLYSSQFAQFISLNVIGNKTLLIMLRYWYICFKNTKPIQNESLLHNSEPGEQN